MADASHQRAVALRGEPLDGSLALAAIGAGDADLDQLVIVQGPPGLRHHGRADAGTADPDDGIQVVGQPFEVPALLFGEFHPGIVAALAASP